MAKYMVVQEIEPVGRFKSMVLKGDEFETYDEAARLFDDMIQTIDGNLRWHVLGTKGPDHVSYTYKDGVLKRKLKINYSIEKTEDGE